MGETKPYHPPIQISLTADPDREKLERVIRGLEESGATLECVGRIAGSLMQGKAIDANGDEREGVTVTAREQLTAVRLVAELRGLITKKTEQKNETVMKLRLDRQRQEGGELGEVLRRLPSEKRDELLALLGAPKVIDAIPERTGA